MSAVLLIVVIVATLHPIKPAIRDLAEPICFAIGDTANAGRERIYLRLDEDGKVAISDAIAPSTAPDHYWSWRMVRDSAEVKFSGIDSGEQFRFRLERDAQRAPRMIYWANNGGGSKSDTVSVRSVACATVRANPQGR